MKVWISKRYTHTETMTLVFPNSAYADPEAAFTAPVLKTVSHHKLEFLYACNNVTFQQILQ